MLLCYKIVELADDSVDTLVSERRIDDEQGLVFTLYLFHYINLLLDISPRFLRGKEGIPQIP